MGQIRIILKQALLIRLNLKMNISPSRPAAGINRRGFLKTGLIVTAAVGVTVCGGGALAATYQPPVDLPSASLGPAGAGERALVVYGSKAGSTAQIAARIGEVLPAVAGRGLAVDVLPVSKAGDLAPYRTVIVGSAIRMGRVLPEVMTFIEKNQSVLQQKAFSLFVACMTLQQDTPENRKTVSAYLDPVRALVQPASEGLFAGVLDPGKLPLLDRLIIAAMQAPTGDFRNWPQISAWSEKL